MANFDKFSRGACGHMLKHFERAKDANGEYVRFGNQDIDLGRSYLNYNLGPERSEAQYTFIKQRCSEVHCLKRKDVNVLGSWVVTAPKDLPDDQLKPFFEASYNALEQKYGRENVVSSYVHMDESGRPHMHFAFVPVMYDKKKDRYSVCAKQLVTRTELARFHPWLEGEVSRQLGFQVKLMNDATREGNQTVTELKRKRELEKQAAFEEQTQEAEKKAVEAERRTAELQRINRQAYEDYRKAMETVAAANAEKDEITKQLSALRTPEDILKMAEPSRQFNGSVTVPMKEYDQLRAYAEMAAAAVKYGDAMQSDYDELFEELQKAEEEVAELRRQAEMNRSSDLKIREAAAQQQVKILQKEKEQLERLVTDLVSRNQALQTIIQMFAQLMLALKSVLEKVTMPLEEERLRLKLEEHYGMSFEDVWDAMDYIAVLEKSGGDQREREMAASYER